MKNHSWLSIFWPVYYAPAQGFYAIDLGFFGFKEIVPDSGKYHLRGRTKADSFFLVYVKNFDSKCKCSLFSHSRVYLCPCIIFHVFLKLSPGFLSQHTTSIMSETKGEGEGFKIKCFLFAIFMSFQFFTYLTYTFHYAREYFKNYKIVMFDLLQVVIFCPFLQIGKLQSCMKAW